MDEETRKYYDTYFEFFSSDGWRQFSSELEKAMEGTEKATIRQADKDVFLQNVGYVGALSYILSYPDFVKRTFEEIEDAV